MRNSDTMRDSAAAACFYANPLYFRSDSGAFVIVLIMGVAGAGKTTIGQSLAAHLGFDFEDADNFHSSTNIEKMRRGIPLTDADRAPWLEAMRAAILSWIRDGKNVVLACSALKQAYRERLIVGPEVEIVYLKGSYDVIADRLRERKGHYATEQLLESQFAALEEPTNAVVVNIDSSPQKIVDDIRAQLSKL